MATLWNKVAAFSPNLGRSTLYLAVARSGYRQGSRYAVKQRSGQAGGLDSLDGGCGCQTKMLQALGSQTPRCSTVIGKVVSTGSSCWTLSSSAAESLGLARVSATLGWPLRFLPSKVLGAALILLAAWLAIASGKRAWCAAQQRAFDGADYAIGLGRFVQGCWSSFTRVVWLFSASYRIEQRCSIYGDRHSACGPSVLAGQLWLFGLEAATWVRPDLLPVSMCVRALQVAIVSEVDEFGRGVIEEIVHVKTQLLDDEGQIVSHLGTAP